VRFSGFGQISASLAVPAMICPVASLSFWMLLVFARSVPLIDTSSSTFTDTGVTIDTFSNSGLFGPPLTRASVPDTSFIAASEEGVSAYVYGTVYFPSNGSWIFDCAFVNTAVGFVWIDGHLVCQDGNTYNVSAGAADNPLPVRTAAGGRGLAIRAHMYKDAARAREPMSLSVRWGLNTSSSMAAIPSAALRPHLSAVEQQRDKLQASSTAGWRKLLHHNVLTFTSLPAGIAFTPTVCQISTKTCIDFCVADGLWKKESGCDVRVGPYAINGSYGQFFFGGRHGDNRSFVDANISVSFAAYSNNSLAVSMELIEPHRKKSRDILIRMNSRFLWNRSGIVSTDAATSSIVFSPAGLPTSRVAVLAPFVNASVPRSPLGSENDVFVELGPEPLSVAVNLQDVSSSTVAAMIAAAKESHAAQMLSLSGGDPRLAELATAVEAAVSWTAISTPAENNAVLLPVSRGWTTVPPMADFRADGEDWSYAIFDWDNLFASLLAAAVGSKNIAYSNIIQSFKSKAAEGYLANCAGGGYKNQDRTEPLVGARVLLELFRRYNDTWLVELVFDDVLDWVDWTSRARTRNHGLYTLRSFDERRGQPGGMQLARFESGLDNSPMYDCASVDQQDNCDLWDKSSGTMMLLDVGMSSMAASEAYALSELAVVVGRQATAKELRARGDAYRQAVHEQLWDETRGVYANLVLTNGSLSERVSPTSFYPLLLGSRGMHDDARAEEIVRRWLTNASRFCVQRRSNECYWGLPSISADDDSFAALGYWRGFVWGPMAQLVHWSLKEFDHVPSVRVARKALAQQMSEMFMNQWRLHGHVCENYLPHKNGTEVDGKVWPDECTGTTFYHWGALSGLIELTESASESIYI